MLESHDVEQSGIDESVSPPLRDTVTNVSGGVVVDTQGGALNVGRDVVARDKVIDAETYIERAEIHYHMGEVPRTFDNEQPAADSPLGVDDQAVVPHEIGTSLLGEEEEREDSGFLDWVVELHEALDQVAQVMVELTELLNTHNAGVISRTQATKQAWQSGDAKRVRRIARENASEMAALAVEIADRLPLIHQSWEQYKANMKPYITVANVRTRDEFESLVNLRKSTATLLESVQGSIDSVSVFRGSVSSSRGISRDLNAGVTRLTRVLDAQLTETEHARAICADTLALMDEKIAAFPLNENT